MGNYKGFASINNVHSLLKKAEYHYHKIFSTIDIIERDYHIIDCVLSLNMLFEYILNDNKLDEPIKQTYLYSFYPYKDPSKDKDYKIHFGVNPPNLNIFQFYIRQLSNNFKHFINDHFEFKCTEWNSPVCMGDSMIGDQDSYMAPSFTYYIKGEQDNPGYNLLNIISEQIKAHKDFFTRYLS